MQKRDTSDVHIENRSGRLKGHTVCRTYGCDHRCTLKTLGAEIRAGLTCLRVGPKAEPFFE